MVAAAEQPCPARSRSWRLAGRAHSLERRDLIQSQCAADTETECRYRVDDAVALTISPVPPAGRQASSIRRSPAETVLSLRVLSWSPTCSNAAVEKIGVPFMSGSLSSRLATLVVLVSAVVVSGCGGSGGASSPTGPSNVSATITGSGVSTYTYTTDVRPIINADCVQCHGPSQRQAGVDLSSYSGVMQVTAAGNASSILILVTQPGGAMYSQLSGNRNAKAGTIYDWVVNSKAAQ